MTIGRIPSVEGGIQPTIVDAKGDLIAATAADTVNRLAVGSNDQVLVADSATSTGLAWKSYGAQFVAGKNKIINGDFYWNQRAFTSTTVDGAYGFDRWVLVSSGGATYSAETFTVGTAPVAGYESRNFARLVTTGQTATSTYSFLVQRIEDVRTFANQTVTISFWAKANSGTPKISLEMTQQFGSGGSPSSAVNTYAGQVTIGTTWQRYNVSFPVPTISGKTIGTTTPGFLSLNMWVSAGSDFNARTSSLGIQSNTFDIWGVQVEAGSVATPFTTATGTIQGELAACQRYLPVLNATSSNAQITGYSPATNTWNGTVFFPVTARVKPTGITVSTPVGTYFSFRDNTNTLQTVTAITYDNASLNSCNFLATTTSTQGTAGRLILADGTILFTGCEL